MRLGHSRKLYSHNCEHSQSAVNAARKGEVNSQSLLRSIVNLDEVMCEVKDQKSAVNGQTTEKSWSRS